MVDKSSLAVALSIIAIIIAAAGTGYTSIALGDLVRDLQIEQSAVKKKVTEQLADIDKVLQETKTKLERTEEARAVIEKELDRRRFLESLVEGARREGKLVLYTHSVIDKEVVDLFMKKYPFLQGKVETVRLSSDRIGDRLLAESAAGLDKVDFLRLNTPQMPLAIEKGWYKAIKDVLAKLETRQAISAWVDPQGRFIHHFVAYEAPVAYNPKLVKEDEMPRTWKDLLDPKWKGKISMGGPLEDSLSAWSFAGLRDFMGKDEWVKFLRGLAAQRPLYHRSPTPVAVAVAQGESAIGITFGPSALREGAKQAYVFTDPIPSFTSLVGVYARADHPNAALLYLDFLFSIEGLFPYTSIGYWVSRLDIPRENIPDPRNLDLNFKYFDFTDPKLRDEVIAVFKDVFG